MKGAFGGGFPIVGIPLLSLVTDPVTSGGLLEHCSSRWTCSRCVTGSLRHGRGVLKLLVPGLVAGIGLGYVLFRVLDHRAVAIMMALTTLIFVALWLVGESQAIIRPRSWPKAVAARVASGVTTMVAHSGGPPLAMYLLPLGLSKEVYAGTTSMFFTVGKAPWLLLVRPAENV
ncbi:TSUP family transporter [Bradyrhizobium sp. USDA 3364]